MRGSKQEPDKTPSYSLSSTHGGISICEWERLQLMLLYLAHHYNEDRRDAYAYLNLQVICIRTKDPSLFWTVVMQCVCDPGRAIRVPWSKTDSLGPNSLTYSPSFELTWLSEAESVSRHCFSRQISLFLNNLDNLL
jgi:hypothetical protein